MSKFSNFSSLFPRAVAFAQSSTTRENLRRLALPMAYLLFASVNAFADADFSQPKAIFNQGLGLALYIVIGLSALGAVGCLLTAGLNENRRMTGFVGFFICTGVAAVCGVIISVISTESGTTLQPRF